MSGARALWRVVCLARPRRGLLALSVLLAVLAVGSAIGLMATSGYLISRAALRPGILTLTVAIVAVRFFGVSRAVFRYLERLSAHEVALRVLAELRARFFARLVPLVPGGLSGVGRGDLLSRIVSDVEGLQHLFVRALGPPIVAVGVIALTAGVAWGMLPAAAWVLALVLLAAAVLIPLTAGAAGRASGRRQAPARAALTGELVEVLEGAPELVAYGQEPRRRARLRAADAALVRLARRDALVGSAASGLVTLFTGVAVVAVLAVAVPAVRSGVLDGVLLAALALLALASFEGIAPLPVAAQHLAATAGAAERLEAVTDRDPPVRDPVAPRALAGPGALAVEGARVRYAPDGPWILDRVDLRLAPGRRVALVGPSGAGKSTLAAALVCFLDLDEGRITLDGHPLGDYAQADVRDAVRLAPQGAHLFATTIRDNVRLGRPGASEAEVLGALGRAGAGPWVATLPGGLDTQVGEEGAQVSGGQRQRIALARALIAAPRVLILDEPTAHLDAPGARALMADVLDAARGTALLVITHDLDGLEAFDEIVVLEGGRVAERGRWTELTDRPGRLRTMVNRGLAAPTPGGSE